jgi:opacity protein-like surface antigen
MLRNTLLAAAVLATGLAAAAQAQQVISQGESFSVTYPPGYTGNIVGGGEVLQTVGESPRVIYASPQHSAPPPGMPFDQGGQGGEVVYLPAPGVAVPSHSVAAR